MLVRLGHLTGNPNYALIADDVLSGLAEHAAKSAHGYSRLLCAADLAVGPLAEVAIISDPKAEDTRKLLDALRAEYQPRVLIAVAHPDDDDAVEAIPLLADRPQLEGKATAYVCLNFACKLPVTDAAGMMAQVREIG